VGKHDAREFLITLAPFLLPTWMNERKSPAIGIMLDESTELEWDKTFEYKGLKIAWNEADDCCRESIEDWYERQDFTKPSQAAIVTVTRMMCTMIRTGRLGRGRFGE
jgi:hypothetical protein